MPSSVEKSEKKNWKFWFFFLKKLQFWKSWKSGKITKRVGTRPGESGLSGNVEIWEIGAVWKFFIDTNNSVKSEKNEKKIFYPKICSICQKVQIWKKKFFSKFSKSTRSIKKFQFFLTFFKLHTTYKGGGPCMWNGRRRKILDLWPLPFDLWPPVTFDLATLCPYYEGHMS